MTRIAEYRDALRALDPAAWPAYLDAHSGLPGPRGNIELAVALAELAGPEVDDELIASGDEYRTFCGVLGLGSRASDPAVTARLHGHASDERWRVREAVAMALQRLGDADLPALESIVLTWAGDPDPLVVRAAAAAICEPRLIGTPEAAAVAVEVCRRATAALAAVPAGERRRPAVRTLRQGLGYCWSVAVAADPGPGLVAFHALDSDDPDVAWVVRENLGKKRLARLV
ncbi:HEAT repeat domain-containing protein [Nocardioides sp.]|uniref:HEAT repeat domain-containing protein n=1 Tax=Nocardioides sp. TaxID=35761 RepID=UPI0037846586